MQSFPWLDEHQSRITPTLSQLSVPAAQKSPKEIQRDASELIQRLEKEKAEDEILAKKYREMNQLKMDEEEKRKGYAQIAQGVFGAKIVEEEPTDSTNPNSGANRPTIGSTTISTDDAETIREEARKTIARAFLGIQMGDGSN